MPVPQVAKSSTLTPGNFVQDDEIEISASATHVLITLHGLRSGAGWGHKIVDQFRHRKLAQKYGITLAIQPIDYGYLSSLNLTLGDVNDEIIKRVIKFINVALAINPNAQFFLLCHSYGSKIMAEILTRPENREIIEKFVAVIFAGSVIQTDFFVNLCNKFPQKPKFINYFSTNDVIPVLAEAIMPKKFYASGVFGLNAPCVQNFFFKNGHSGCIDFNHFDNYILKLIATGGKFMTRPPPVGKSIFSPSAPLYIRRAILFFFPIAVIALYFI